MREGLVNEYPLTLLPQLWRGNSKETKSMNECKTCSYWKRLFNRNADDWEYVCTCVVDHYQLRPDSKGVDVCNTAGNDNNDCGYWSPQDDV